MFEPKKKKFIVELDSNWVLQHRNDDELPIAAMKAELSKDKTLIIKESSLTSMTIIYTEDTADYSGIKGVLMRFFKNRYPEDKPNEIMSFKSGIADDEDQPDNKPEKSETDEETREKIERRRRELIRRMSELEEDDEDEDSDSSENTSDPIEKINALVGATEFKALAKEIIDIADEIKSTDTYEVFTNQCYLFSIGDGCGLTTYLELFAKLVSDKKLCNMSSRPVREERLGAYRESAEPFEDANRALSNGSTKNLKVLCIDISEWMDKTDNRFFKQFLRAVEKHADEYIVVFRVPFVDKDILARIKYSLSDLLSVRAVSFPPLSQEEIKTCAEAELKRYKFSITKTAWKYFFDRISEEKSDGKFYGVNTVKKVIRELVYQKHIANSQKQTKSKQITMNDAKALCDNVSDSNLTGAEQLDKLIGVEGIKKRVEEIIAQRPYHIGLIKTRNRLIRAICKVLTVR